MTARFDLIELQAEHEERQAGRTAGRPSSHAARMTSAIAARCQRGVTEMLYKCLIHSALAISVLSPLAQPSYANQTLEEVLNEPYFDASDIEAVRKGGFGVAKIHEVSDREIAVVSACLVKTSREQALAPFLAELLTWAANLSLRSPWASWAPRATSGCSFASWDAS